MDCLNNYDTDVRELVEALRQIRELTERRQLPLTTQVNDIARVVLAKHERPTAP